MSQEESKPRSSRACLGVALGLILAMVLGCVLLVAGVLVVRHLYSSGTVRSGGAPQASASLRVLPDGCTVERGEVQGRDAVTALTWIIQDASGATVLERDAENERTYRHFQPGDYSVTLEAWFAGAYWPVSDTVWILCD